MGRGEWGQVLACPQFMGNVSDHCTYSYNSDNDDDDNNDDG